MGTGPAVHNENAGHQRKFQNLKVASLPDVTAFVGRARDLERLDRALGREDPLSTLVGPGGVGKSRLAREVASRWRDRFEGGVAFAPLARASSADEIPRLLLEALDERSRGAGDPVAEVLEERAPTLIVLDNAEHLLDAVRAHLTAWLGVSGAHRWIVTSQTRLALQRERVVPVEPLELRDAVALLDERIERVAPGARRDPDVLAALAERLDRLPLALELAASRATVLSLEQIADRLSDRFALLRSRHVDRDPRHRTLEATVDWALGLLDAPLREALASCAAFDGPFDLEAAEVVLASPGDEPVLDRLQTLVERSLLTVSRDAGGPRFELLQSIRERVRRGADLAAARARCVEFVLRRHAPEGGVPFATLVADAPQLKALVEEADAPGIAARAAYALAPVIEASATREAHGALLRRAIALAVESGDARTEALARLALARARYVEDPDDARRQVARAGAEDDPLVAAERRCVEAFVLRHEGRLDEAVEAAGRALASLRGGRAARMHQEVAVLHMLAGRPEEARRAYALALEGHRAVGDERAAAEVDAHLGVLALDTDDALARRHLERALAAHRAAGDRRRVAMVLSNLAVLAHQTGALDVAEARWNEALAAHRAVGHPRFEAFALCGLGAVLHERGELGEALALVERGCAIFAVLHDPRWEGWARSRRGALRAARGDRDGARADFDAARAALRASGGDAWLGAVDILEQTRGAPPAEAPRTSAERLAWRLVRSEPRAEALAPQPGAVRLARDAAWFERDGDRVDLRRRRAMRGLLAALIAQRIDAPGDPLDTPALVEAGWPGERMREDSGAARVYTAIRTLRRMGLDGVLARARGGYLLHAQVPVDVVDGAPVG